LGGALREGNDVVVVMVAAAAAAASVVVVIEVGGGRRAAVRLPLRSERSNRDCRLCQRADEGGTALEGAVGQCVPACACACACV
jgi:hypothetical protein